MWPFSKRLVDALDEARKIKIEGVIFYITKINPLDYVSGSEAVRSFYEFYTLQDPNKKIDQGLVKKMKKHYADVILASVVEPKLSRKPDQPGAIWIDNLLNSYQICEELYYEIMKFSYGKKKLRQLKSLGKSALK